MRLAERAAALSVGNTSDVQQFRAVFRLPGCDFISAAQEEMAAPQSILLAHQGRVQTARSAEAAFAYPYVHSCQNRGSLSHLEGSSTLLLHVKIN